MSPRDYQKIRADLSFAKSPYRLAVQLLSDFSLAGLIVYGIFDGSLFLYSISQVLLPIFLFRAFAVMHEAVHNSLSDSRTINTVFGQIYGTLCFLPFSSWRATHLEHHLWAGNLERDPTMRLPKDFERFPHSSKQLIRFWWRNWLPIMAALQHLVFWLEAFRRPKDSNLNLARSILIFFPVAAFIFCLASTSIYSPFALGVLPGVTLYFLLLEAVNLPHHLEVPFLENHQRLAARDQHAVSRSCKYPRKFERLVLLNFNFHTEHHLYPDLPWHQLDKVFVLVQKKKLSTYHFESGWSWIRRARAKEMDKVLESIPQHGEEKKVA